MASKPNKNTKIYTELLISHNNIKKTIKQMIKKIFKQKYCVNVLQEFRVILLKYSFSTVIWCYQQN